MSFAVSWPCCSFPLSLVRCCSSPLFFTLLHLVAARSLVCAQADISYAFFCLDMCLTRSPVLHRLLLVARFFRVLVVCVVLSFYFALPTASAGGLRLVKCARSTTATGSSKNTGGSRTCGWRRGSSLGVPLAVHNTAFMVGGSRMCGPARATRSPVVRPATACLYTHCGALFEATDSWPLLWVKGSTECFSHAFCFLTALRLHYRVPCTFTTQRVCLFDVSVVYCKLLWISASVARYRQLVVVCRPDWLRNEFGNPE